VIPHSHERSDMSKPISGLAVSPGWGCRLSRAGHYAAIDDNELGAAQKLTPLRRDQAAGGAQ
jgi:hypothetical protein